MTSTSRSFAEPLSVTTAPAAAAQSRLPHSRHDQSHTAESPAEGAAVLIRAAGRAWRSAYPASLVPKRHKSKRKLASCAQPIDQVAENPSDHPARIAQELSEAIRSQVIPRLLSAHGCAPHPIAASASLSRCAATPSPDPAPNSTLDSAAIAHLCVRADGAAVEAACRGLLAEGLSRDGVFLERMAPAASLLGEFWRDDVYSFVEVGLGMCHLRQAFERLRAEEADPLLGSDGFSVLIAPAPGETHGFGAALIARLFTQAGWAVTAENPGDEQAILGQLRARRFELLGLSLNTDRALEGLAGFVLKAKRESKNQNLIILLGGSLIAARPEIAREVGAIAAPNDPRRAIDEAEQIVRRAVRRM
jgi:methanogenic corrinoid protein MtbC1